MAEMISTEDEMPEPGALVSVYNEHDNKYGYARLVSRKKYGEAIYGWSYDVRQDIEF